MKVWKWQKTGRINLAGEITLVTGLVMWITSLPQIRRQKFEFFYYTHHLYIIFLIFFLFHAGDRHFYMDFGGIFLFGLDKLLRILQSRPETSILSAKVFPSRAIELTLPKDPSKSFSSPCEVINLTIKSVNKSSDKIPNCRLEVYTYKCNIYEDTKHFQIAVAFLQYNFQLKYQ